MTVGETLDTVPGNEILLCVAERHTTSKLFREVI